MKSFEDIKEKLQSELKNRGIKQYSDGKTHGFVQLFPELEQYQIEPGTCGMIMLHCLSKKRVRDAIIKVFDVPGELCYCEDLFEGQCEFCYKKDLLKELGLGK